MNVWSKVQALHLISLSQGVVYLEFVPEMQQKAIRSGTGSVQAQYETMI